MAIVFYMSALVALLSVAMVVTRSNAVHALLYLIVSLLAVAMIFFALGAPFVAALQVIIYAGAIMVLFVFVVMMLGGEGSADPQMRRSLSPRGWIGPAILAGILLVELAFVIFAGGDLAPQLVQVDPKQVGTTLFVKYLLGVELASLLLLAGLVGAYHLGRRDFDEASDDTHPIDRSEARP